MEKRKEYMGNLMLLLTSLIWGSAIIAQTMGMDYVGPFTFIAARCTVGAIFMVPCIYYVNKLRGHVPVHRKNKNHSQLILGGVLCGLALFAGMAFQQVGLMYTTVAKTGFISTLYIVIVPLCGIFLKRKISLNMWLGVVLAATGLYFLSISEGFMISKGDLLIMICALAYSAHIMIIDYFATRVDGMFMSCIQFFVASVLGIFFMFWLEQPTISSILSAWVPILYAGVLSTGIAYTLQILAQRYTQPTTASLLLSLEAVFAAVIGWIMLGETLSTREFFGCFLIFAAVIMAQVPLKKLLLWSKTRRLDISENEELE